MTIADDLSRLMQDHEDEPDAAADALRRIAGLEVPADQFGVSRGSWIT